MKEWKAYFLDSDVDGRVAHFVEIDGQRYFASDARDLAAAHNAEKHELEAEKTRLREGLIEAIEELESMPGFSMHSALQARVAMWRALAGTPQPKEEKL